MVDMGVFAPPDSVANATIGLCVGDKNMQEGVIANEGAEVGLCERGHYNAFEWVVTDIPTPPNHI